MKGIWLSILVALLQPAAFAQAVEEPPDCARVSECIAILRDYQIDPPPRPGEYWSRGVNPKPIKNAEVRLPSFGDAGVTALLVLLKHPNPNVRIRAAYVLGRFSRIAPRHVTALIAARRTEGVGGWLDGPIAKTGTDEALDFLWSVFESDPDQGSNSQVFFALPKFGERVLPRLAKELQACGSSRDVKRCDGVDVLLQQFKPYPSFALQLMEEIAKSPDVAAGVRKVAKQRLISEAHPYGLVLLLEQFRAEVAALETSRPADDGIVQTEALDWSLAEGLSWEITQISSYGEKAAAAGPWLVRLLDRHDLPDIRLSAALAIGSIGYRDGAAALLHESADFEDAWEFAYNAVESLGRLKATEARPVLEQLAATHWNRAVRNNAERALNLIKGGAFARPGVAGDGDAWKPDTIGPRWVDLRYAGDFMGDPPVCKSVGERIYEQFFPDESGVMQRADSPAIETVTPELTHAESRLRFVYDFPNPYGMQGDIGFVVKAGDGLLIGTNAGEFGGSIYDAGRPGGVRVLIADNAIAAFRMGDTLLVATGLSHMISTHGELWVVDIGDSGPQVKRHVQLPSEPNGFAIAYPDTLVIKSEYGDVGVRADGAVIDVRRIAGCGVS